MLMQKKEFSGRIVYLDALRLLASFFVIVNHTYDYVRLSEASSTVRLASFASMSLANAAVPIFLMISGCTLLTKQDTLKKTFSRILRTGLALVLFSFVYEIYRFAAGQIETISIKRFLLFIYEQHTTTAYWYLYMYLGLLLMLPFLQKLFAAMQRQDFLLFFGISLFFVGFWPLVVEYTSMSAYNEQFALPLFGSSITYLFWGGFLHTHLKKNPPAWLSALLVLTCTLICAAATNHAYAATSGSRYLFLDDTSLLPVILTSLGIFFLFRQIPFSDRAARIVHTLGSASFGIYLLSDLFISILFPLCALLRGCLPVFAAVTLYQLAIWLASLVCALVLRRIPGLNKLL